MNIEAADRIIQFMDKYLEEYRAMVMFLTEKQAKVMADDLLWLLESAETEQAHIMKIQSQENARLALFDEMGLTGVKAEQMIAEMPENRSQRMKMIYDKLVEYISEIRRLNSEIVETVERKLEVQEELVRGAGMTVSESYNGYGAKIKRTDGSKGFIGSV